MVGDPPMNLLPAELRDGGNGPVVELAFGAVQGGPWAGALKSFPAGTRLWFGVRPHDLAPAAATPRGPRIDSRVHLTEPLGDVTILDLEANGLLFKMVLPEEQALAFSVGGALTVDFRLEHSHVFARDTGIVIR